MILFYKLKAKVAECSGEEHCGRDKKKAQLLKKGIRFKNISVNPSGEMWVINVLEDSWQLKMV